jgi:8-oxo-dGTP diphosphatase
MSPTDPGRKVLTVFTETSNAGPTASALVAAGALFTNESGEILLVRPTYKPYWDIPGGYVEPGESPRSACNREVREELGLNVQLGRMLSIDWAPHPEEGDKILFIFDGGRLTLDQLQSIRLDDNELSAYQFATPEELDDLTIPRLARRLRATFKTQQLNDAGSYLEEGMPA